MRYFPPTGSLLGTVSVRVALPGALESRERRARRSGPLPAVSGDASRARQRGRHGVAGIGSVRRRVVDSFGVHGDGDVVQCVLPCAVPRPGNAVFHAGRIAARHRQRAGGVARRIGIRERRARRSGPLPAVSGDASRARQRGRHGVAGIGSVRRRVVDSFGVHGDGDVVQCVLPCAVPRPGNAVFPAARIAARHRQRAGGVARRIGIRERRARRSGPLPAVSGDASRARQRGRHGVAGIGSVRRRVVDSFGVHGDGDVVQCVLPCAVPRPGNAVFPAARIAARHRQRAGGVARRIGIRERRARRSGPLPAVSGDASRARQRGRHGVAGIGSVRRRVVDSFGVHQCRSRSRVRGRSRSIAVARSNLELNKAFRAISRPPGTA